MVQHETPQSIPTRGSLTPSTLTRLPGGPHENYWNRDPATGKSRVPFGVGVVPGARWVREH